MYPCKDHSDNAKETCFNKSTGTLSLILFKDRHPEVKVGFSKFA